MIKTIFESLGPVQIDLSSLKFILSRENFIKVTNHKPWSIMDFGNLFQVFPQNLSSREKRTSINSRKKKRRSVRGDLNLSMDFLQRFGEDVVMDLRVIPQQPNASETNKFRNMHRGENPRLELRALPLSLPTLVSVITTR